MSCALVFLESAIVLLPFQPKGMGRETWIVANRGIHRQAKIANFNQIEVKE